MGYKYNKVYSDFCINRSAFYCFVLKEDWENNDWTRNTMKKIKTPQGFLFWQGRQDSNLQHLVLETSTLPLSYSPVLC